MSNFDIDAVLKSENKRIEEILCLSESVDPAVEERGPVCPKCRKEQSSPKNSSDHDLRRWKFVDSIETNSYISSHSKCLCNNKLDVRRKYDNSKPKRKGQFDISRYDMYNGKDFIAHNIRTCNSIRFKDSYIGQNCSSFVHYKNTNEYILQYRFQKLDKLEGNRYQMEQTVLNEEMMKSAPNSLSNLTRRINVDGSLAKDIPSDIFYGGKELRLAESSQKSIQKLNCLSDTEVGQQQRRQLAKELETCMRCGDKLKKQDLPTSISNGKRLEQKFPLRMTHEKHEDKKASKLTKRASDHRQRLIMEKSASVGNRPDVEQAVASELQPFCQQMPIKTSILVDKRSNVKSGWSGHPSSTKPKYPTEIAGASEATRRSETSSVKKASIGNIDIFNCYGERHRLLKEST